MSDQFEPPASSASDSASDDDAMRQREHFTADTALGAGSTSGLPLDEQASAALTEPRKARLTWRLGSDERTGRRSSWVGSVGAFMATALVVTLISYLLVHLASARSTLGDSPTGTPSLTALATAATAATATGTATVAPPATVTPAGLGSGGHPTPGFTVQSIPTASVDFGTDGGPAGLATETGAPIPSATGGCGPYVAFRVTFTIKLSNNPTPPNQQVGNTALIGYYIRNSDGSSDGSAAHPVYEMIPSGGTAMTIYTSWQIPYTQANGASQWTELDIVQPNQISYRANFKALCVFSLYEPIVSASPTTYNCATGGNQTFTLTGTLKPTFTTDNTSHTITYFWEYDFSTHGTTTPTQTVTFPPGVTSMSIQPETVIGNAATQTASFQAFLYVNYAAWQYHSSVTVTSAC